MKNCIVICVLIFSFYSCEKSAGEGGTSIIEGRILKTFTDKSEATGLDTTYYLVPMVGKDVFIIYSDNENELYDDKYETDHRGKYRFEYLRKGDYTIYTYADSVQTYDNSNPIPVDALLEYEYPIFRNIKISSNNSTNNVDDFIVEKNP